MKGDTIMTNNELDTVKALGDLEMMDRSMSEHKAYELMKVCDIVGKYLPDADYETIWDMANQIYSDWENDDDKTAYENAYIQQYADKWMKESGCPDPERIKQITWNQVINAFPRSPKPLPFSYDKAWTDGSEILASSLAAAEHIADVLCLLGLEPHTGWYDPEEDERGGEVDDHTGWHYIDSD